MSDKRVIHLVDDEDAIRRSAGFLLRTAGFDVVTYASGSEFLAAAEQAVPGCILLDIRMPGIDGLEVQRILGERVGDQGGFAAAEKTRDERDGQHIVGEAHAARS